MEARAIHRYIGTSPRKMRLLIDLIRGKSVDEALNILHFTPKHASKVAEKVLRSAVSNLQAREDGGRLGPEDMVVKAAYVDGGMTMKRISRDRRLRRDAIACGIADTVVPLRADGCWRASRMSWAWAA